MATPISLSALKPPIPGPWPARGSTTTNGRLRWSTVTPGGGMIRDQHIVHRPRQRPAVDDQLGLELQDVGCLHGHVLEILVAPLPQDVEKQHAALPGIQAVLGGGGPGEGARRGHSRALGVCHVRAPVLVDLSR